MRSRNYLRLGVACALVTLLAPASAPLARTTGPVSPAPAVEDQAPATPRFSGWDVGLTAWNSARRGHELLPIIAEDQRVAAEIQGSAARLRAGHYVWRPERGERGPVKVVVSIATQRAYVFRSGQLIGVSTVSTGRPGHDTPTGTFPILQKKRMHHSNLYNDAPMPNMQRLTWDGVALHAGVIREGPASHGCVRLPTEFSNLLYGVTSIGSEVHIVRGTPPSASGALRYAGLQGGRGRQVASAAHTR